MPPITRRAALAASAAALAAPGFAQPAASRVLRFVPHANLTSLDPVWTTAYVTRNHGYLVYDTLFAMAEDLTVQPQMAEGHTVEDDGLRWTITLRDGLRFHDGEPVRAQDAAASIRRWGRRDALGQSMMEAVGEVAALDDRRLVIRLRRPFPMVVDALGKRPMFVLPERLAATDAFTQVNDATGSGPFRFVPGEWVPGAQAVYARFEGYVPRQAPANGLAGGKVARLDRVEWRIMPDPATVAAALQAREIDWWEIAASDLLPLLARNRGIVIERIDPFGSIALLRPNHLQPPFNNPAFRRALWPALDQADFMTAVIGTDRSRWHDGVGFFTPDTALANGAGLEAVTGPRSLDAAKRAIEASGYRGERLVFLHTTDLPSHDAMGHVTADLFRRLGLNLDAISTDWGTVVQRRARREPVEQGGWSAFVSNTAGAECLGPATNPWLRANGTRASFGWPDSPGMEAARNAWFDAPDLAAQRRCAEDFQRAAFQDVPFYPLGQFHQPAAWRRGITGQIRSHIPVLWNVAKTR